MEAKVDIQKLQILNDRIAQTIDALNQVRMSVHGVHGVSQQQGLWGGLAHTPYTPYAPYGYGQMGQLGQQQFTGTPWLGQQQVPGGLAHTQYIPQVDPMRFAQTFPFAQYEIPPFRSF